jgi:hypothetical protein
MTLDAANNSHRYVAAAQACFTSLQECAARLAGLLMSTEIKHTRHALDTQSLNEAEKCIADATERFATLVPTEKCLHFHYHLSESLELLAFTVVSVFEKRAGSATGLDPLPVLQKAWAELTHASRALPGFETVDFRQSCCSIHKNAIATRSLGDLHV